MATPTSMYQLALSLLLIAIVSGCGTSSTMTVPNGSAGGNDKTVKAELRLASASASAGDEIALTMDLEIAPTWEIRTLNDSFAGAATKLDLTLPAGIEAVGEWQSPKATRSATPDGHDAHAGKCTFTRTLKVTDSAAKGAQEIACELQYQACNDTSCMMPTGQTLEVTLEVK